MSEIDHAAAKRRAEAWVKWADKVEPKGALFGNDDKVNDARAYLALAREVKGAPREPTPEMRKAGKGRWMTNDLEEVALITWQKMYDAWAAARGK